MQCVLGGGGGAKLPAFATIKSILHLVNLLATSILVWPVFGPLNFIEPLSDYSFHAT